MDENGVRETIVRLISHLYSDDNGVDETTHKELNALVHATFGHTCMVEFNRRINATDGRFYFRDTSFDWVRR